METQTLHRGRLIDHIQLVVKDLATSQLFYSATLAAQSYASTLASV